VLVLAPAPAQQEELIRIEKEYMLADQLDPAWAARPLALQRHGGRTVLVLEDPGGEPLDRGVGRPFEVERFLRIAIALAASLDQVHRSGLIHHDIKPANLLVDAAGQVRLTGFGIASLLARGQRSVAPTEVIAGTLAYMAPEQTGRMDRSIDARSDLYSAGITFYEMLTGTLPFAASEPLEWMHCHIARPPPPPSEHVRGLPSPVEAIVLKLLAKSPEDRYQTAAGLAADLRRCLEDFSRQHRIDPFPLGAHDGTDRLVVSGKLYGREAEVSELIAAFVRAATLGRTELVLVSGGAGVGKSSIVTQLAKVLDPARGFFAAGKFDQYLRDIPYATLAQAFQDLVRQLLGKNEGELARWRTALAEALGQNGQLMVNLIPELALIIGPQPPVPEMRPRDAMARFLAVFWRFLGVFARADQPLVLFLDDLQWVDAATLELIERLAVEPTVRHVVLVCAYRDDAIDQGHPLVQKVAAMRQAGARVRQVTLLPLASVDVRFLVADALHAEAEQVRPLAELVFEKAQGNPLFVIQFLGTLADEGLLTFDHEKAAWQWDIGRIRARNLADNVADLMATKLARLPRATRDALKLLACLGNAAPVATMASVAEQSEEAINAAMADAVDAGLVQRVGDSCSFLHDRIQEAAYALVPEDERAAIHLRIGRTLSSLAKEPDSADRIFETINHLDRGAALIDTLEEREQVAELNLLAARRAKAATAYASALAYSTAGRALLADDSWARRYRLTFDLELIGAECAFMTGEHDAAMEWLAALTDKAQDLADRAATVCLRVAFHSILDWNDRAVEVGLDYLRRIGIELPAQPTHEIISAEVDRLRRLLAGRPIEALIDLPAMRDPASLSAMDVLAELLPAALFSDRNRHELALLRMANLSIEHGNCDASGYAYANLNVVLGFRFGDYQAGLRFGQLACDLVEKRGLERYKARVFATFGGFVLPWTKPLDVARTILQRAVDAANAAADPTYMIYSSRNLVATNFIAGLPLADVQREAEQALAFAHRVRFGLAASSFNAVIMQVRSLRGLDESAANDPAQGNRRFSQETDKAGTHVALATSWYWIHRIQINYLAEDYAAALEAAGRASGFLASTRAFLEIAEYHFYGALAHAAACDGPAFKPRASHLDALAIHERALAVWGETCPENFANRVALVRAEIARLEGRPFDAERLYDEAIRSARECGFIQNEAIANELAGRFQAARGLATLAEAYLQNARSCYLRWGAARKVQLLGRAHPFLRGASTQPVARTTFGAAAGQLDVGAIVKAAQALSGEIVLGTLLERLMRITVEHAGAERGVLVLLRQGEPQIAAETTMEHGRIEVAVRERPVASLDLPNAALHYVIRTRKGLILGDASTSTLVSDDVYVRLRRSRSILCLPIVKQAKLTGVLYLENDLAPHVFTPDRIAVLELLASQAAISLDNAYLYADLQRSEAFLAEGQRLSRTGSWSWYVATGKVAWSDEHYRIFGYDPRQTVATFNLFLQTVHPDDRLLVKRNLDAAIRDRTGFSFEFRLSRPDGTIAHVQGVGRPVLNESGAVDQYLGSTMDISERKRAEDALRHAEANLVHVARLTTMGELTASIAHEVNQPLAAIVSNAEACMLWLEREQPRLDEARRAAERIIANGQRAGEVIKSVRALARKTALEMTRFDINDAIGEVLDMMRIEMRRNDVSLEADLKAGLPTVTGDRVQLQQVVMNLILNAIEAMSTVSDRPRRLRVASSGEEAGHVLVAVEDSGVGLDAEAMKRLFDSFYTTKREGLGLGLSICRSIISEHGGRLWADANAGPGSTFRFTVPISADDGQP
jgi:PAS domain S-box-containing protein